MKHSLKKKVNATTRKEIVKIRTYTNEKETNVQ